MNENAVMDLKLSNEANVLSRCPGGHSTTTVNVLSQKSNVQNKVECNLYL